MRSTAGLIVISACVLVLGVAMPQLQAQGEAPAAPAQGPGGGRGPARGPQNLKVLPSTWSNQQVGTLMQTFVKSLGLEPPDGPGCGFCHVQNTTGRGFNYAEDQKPEKEVARKMIQMVMDINNNTKDIGDKDVPEKVSCFTCHNGQKKPAKAPADGWGRGDFSLLPAGPTVPPRGAGRGPGGPGGGMPGGGMPGGAMPPAGGGGN